MARIVDVHRSEEGAVFVQVGIALFVLMAFNVFVLDYGMLWVARGQAQNAADAGALAGAVARGFDDFDNPPHHRHSFAAQVARGVAQANNVWQEPATPVVNFACPTGVAGRCTTIAVYRDGQNGSTPLETLFGPLLFVSSQRVRATATALTGNANATRCLRPLAFADLWLEDRDPAGEFNHYIETGPNAGDPFPAGDRDEYTPPSSTSPGRTTISGNFGNLERLIWNFGGADLIHDAITRQRLVTLDLPGGRSFEDNMTGCLGQTIALNDFLQVDVPLSNDHRRISTAIASVFANDSAANFDYSNSRIVNSCAPTCAPVSPRLLAIALYDPRRFQLGRSLNPPNWTHPDVGCPTNQPCIRVTNIIGFFVHYITTGPGGHGPHGHFLRYPGVTQQTAPTFVDDGSWLVTTHLIR